MKQFSLLHLVASTVVRLLWSALQNIPSFVVMVSQHFQLSMCASMICWQPCAVAVISVLRWFLPKIFPRRRSGHSRPSSCVCNFKGSLDNKQTLAPPVTLGARATPRTRRRPVGWKLSQFSRIPDRLCRRRLDD